MVNPRWLAAVAVVGLCAVAASAETLQPVEIVPIEDKGMHTIDCGIGQSCKWGIHFPLVGTRCRIEAWLPRPRDIPWGAWITRERSRNSMSGSRPRRPALRTCSGFVGRMAFGARSAGASLLGERPEGSCGAPSASARPRRRPERYSKVPASRFGRGSRQCGT